VRELKNIIDRMVILSEDGVITEDCLPILYSMNAKEKKESQEAPVPHQNQPIPLASRKSGDILPLRDYKRQAEARYLEWALRQTGGNVAETARRLEMSRRQLFNKINEYQIKK
jgi:two-component system response regulator HydG